MRAVMLYARAQCMRAIRLFPAVLAMSALLAVSLCIVLNTMVSGAAERQVKARIGLVGDLSDDYLSMGIYAVQHMDSSRFAVEFVPVEETQAREQVRNGTLSGYLLIPDGFTESVMYGEQITLTFVSADKTATLLPSVIREVADCAAVYVKESESGVFAMQDRAKEAGISGEPLWDLTEKLDLQYLSMVFSRDDLCDLEQTGAMGTLSVGGYYFCALLFLLVMLLPVMSTSLLSGERKHAAYFAGRGLSASGQTVGEYLAYAVTLLLLLVLFLLCTLFAPKTLIPEWSGAGVGGVFVWMIKLLPALAALSATQFLLWEAVPNTVNGVLLQFLLAISLGFISGCFYPAEFFPDSVRRFAALLPTGQAFALFRDSLAGGYRPLSAVLLTVFAASMLALACGVRAYRIRRGR